MKRLALHLLLCLLTFSAGVGIERILIPKAQAPAVAPPVSATFSDPLPPTSTLLAQPVSVPVSTPTPSQNLILDYDYKQFDPYGYYTILGRKPKGFAEFDGFDLALYHQVGDRLSGDITLTTYSKQNYESYPTAHGLVTERRVYFATAPVSEDETIYRFDGEFLRGNVVSDAPTGKAVLTGTLTKTRKGRKIAEAVIKLQIEYHGC